MRAWLLCTCLIGLGLAGAQAGPCEPRAQGRDLAGVVAQASPAVVRIFAIRPRGAGGDGLAQDEPPASPAESRAVERSVASGFFVGADGLVLSSAHAVRTASEIWVATADGAQRRATLAGVDSRLDLAVLRTQMRPARVLRLAQREPRPGEWVVAMGAPFGFEDSATVGVVSAYPREIPGGDGVGLIQTDVALNPGSSGGPLLDACGEVIGLNSLIFSASGIYIGVSFSMPASRIAPALRQLQAGQRPSRLDIEAQTLTPVLRRALAVEAAAGAIVVRVRAGGEAAAAGLREGDVIVRVRDRAVESADGVRQALEGVQPGERLTVTWWRAGDLHRAEVRSVEMPAAPAPAQAASAPPLQRLGLVLGSGSQPGRPGVEVLAASGPALVAGLEEGDRVLAIHGDAVKDATEFDAALARAAARGRDLVALLVHREGVPIYVAVPLRGE